MSKTAKKYQCIIFDLDGTLIDSASAIADAVIEAAEKHNLPTPAINKIKSGIGRSFDSQYINLFVNGFDESQAHYSYGVKDDFRESFRDIYSKKEMVLFTGAMELLDFLQKSQYSLAIATNGHTSMLNRVLEHFGLVDLFDVTCCGDKFPAKPSPDMLFHIISSLGYDSFEAIMVGDSIYDIAAADNAAMDSILIENHNLGEILSQTSPSFTVKDLSDIIKILRP